MRKLDRIGRELIEIEIERLESLLAGQEVDGLRLGDRGLDAEWVKTAIHDRRQILEAN